MAKRFGAPTEAKKNLSAGRGGNFIYLFAGILLLLVYFVFDMKKSDFGIFLLVVGIVALFLGILFTIHTGIIAGRVNEKYLSVGRKTVVGISSTSAEAAGTPFSVELTDIRDVSPVRDGIIIHTNDRSYICFIENPNGAVEEIRENMAAARAVPPDGAPRP